jgi:hypothetical protein
MKDVAGAVNAMDLDMSNKFYKSVIEKHFEGAEVRYVLATNRNNVILANE